MKRLAILFVITMIGIASGQTGGGKTDPAGLQIVRVELQRTKVRGPTVRAVPATDPGAQAQAKDDRSRSVDNNPALHRLSKDAEVAPLSGSGSFGNATTSNTIVFVASIVVKNIGTKAVRAVNWDYLMFEPGGKEPVKTFHVRSKRTIAPGEQAELMKEVQPKGQEHQAVIVRIEYEDGRFWQAKKN
jgi:hypothetical protein